MATQLWLSNKAPYPVSVSGYTKKGFITAMGSVENTIAANAVASGNHIELLAVNAAMFLFRVRSITIQGSITFEIIGNETLMTTNAGPAVRVVRLDSSGTIISDVVDNTNANHAYGSEWSTSSNIRANWSATPTSTSFNDGDYIGVIIHGDNVGTMGGGAMQVFYGGDTTRPSDSSITFTETLIEYADQGYAQARASILGVSTVARSSQAQAKIKGRIQTFAQAQAKIKAIGVEGFAQAQADIKQRYPNGGLTILAQDDFSEADNTNIIGKSADIGGTYSSFRTAGSTVNKVMSGGYWRQSGTGGNCLDKIGTGTDGNADHYFTAIDQTDNSGGGIFFRGIDSNNVYVTTFADGSITVARITANVLTTVSTNATGAAYPARVHVQVTGSSPTNIKARAWNTGGSEPGTWNIDTNESTSGNQTSAGSFGIDGNSTTASTFVGDDYLVTQGSAVNGPTFAQAQAQIATGVAAYRVYAQAQAQIGSFYQTTIMRESGLVSYWRLGESSGNPKDYKSRNDGIIYNTYGSTYGQTGAISGDANTSIFFNGVSYGTYIDVADHASLDLGSTFSIEFWFKLNTQARTEALIDKGTGAYQVTWDGTYLNLIKVGAATIARATVSGTAWHHAVITNNGASSAKIYLDGIDAGTLLDSSTFTDNAINLSIGRPAGTASNEYDGNLDEVAIYNVALNSTQAWDHFTLGKTGSFIRIAQAQAWIKVTSIGYAQAKAQIKHTYPDPWGSRYYNTIIKDTPLAYWRLGESSGYPQDSIGSAHASGGSGTLSITGAITGDFNTACSFNGSSDYWGINDALAPDPGDVFTVEVWAKLANNPTGIHQLVRRGAGAFSLGYNGSDQTPANTYYLALAGGAQIAQTNVTITDTNWHHIVATKNGSSVYLYIDGIDRTGTVTNQTIGTTGDPMNIGRNQSGPSQYWNGSLDEVAVYGYALTSGQVASHYQAGISEYASQILADTPISYWRLGESSGNPLDCIGPNNVSSVNGTPDYSQSGAIYGDSNTAINLTRSSNERFTVPYDSSLGLGNGPFTLEAWVKPVAPVSQNMAIIGMLGGYYMRLASDATTWKLNLVHSQAAVIVTSNPSGLPVDSNWHHVVASKNGTTSKLYIDGVDVTGTVTDSTIDNPAVNIGIGSEGDGNFDPFDGGLDEVAIYSYALSPEQVLNHYEIGISSSYKPTFAQAQAQIGSAKTTRNGISQAQADVKVTSRSYAQAQADVKATYRGYAQAQAWIEITARGQAQAQGWIKTQALKSYAQAQADIKDTNAVVAQATAKIKGYVQVYTQAQADIKQTYPLAPSPQDITIANDNDDGLIEYFNDDGAVSYTANTSDLNYGMFGDWVNGYGWFQTKESEAFFRFNLPSGTLASATLYLYGQGSNDQTGTIYKTADWYPLDGNDYGISGSSVGTFPTVGTIGWYFASLDVSQVQSSMGGILALKITSNYSHGNADYNSYVYLAGVTAYVRLTYTPLSPTFAQAQANIKITNQALGQAQATIALSISTNRAYAQAQADIKVNVTTYAQAQAWIRITSRGYAQAQTWIKTEAIRGYAQARASIKTSYQGFAQAQTDVKTNYRGYSQAQADVKTTYRNYAQGQAWIKTEAIRGYAQAQAWVKIIGRGYAQAQAWIKTMGLEGFAQSQAWIKTTALKAYAQAQAWVKTTGQQGYAQAMAAIKTSGAGNAQAQALLYIPQVARPISDISNDGNWVGTVRN